MEGYFHRRRYGVGLLRQRLIRSPTVTMSNSGDVIADGRVDAEKLRELLELGAEQEALDFKATLDFTNHKHQIEHVKDLIAMMSLVDGGYIVVGVNGDGQPATDQEEIDSRQFDSATLAQKVSAYVDGRVDIRSAIHELSVHGGVARKVALIYAGPPPGDLPLVVKKQGEYTPAAGGSPVVVMRIGQVIIRDGTLTAPLGALYWERILTRYRENVKAEARRDADALMSRVVALLEQAERGGGGTTTPIDLGMDLSTFAIAAASLVESGSASRLDQFLIPAAGELRAEISRADRSASQAILDRIFALAVMALLYGTVAQFERVIDAVADYYYAIPQISDVVNNTSPAERDRASAWLDVVVRIYALGGLAVRQRKWLELRSLVLHPYSVSPTYRYASWIRHAGVSAARANVLTASDAGNDLDLATAALISRARLVSIRTPELRPDLPYDVATSDTLLNSLCQFDILWCMIAQSATDRPQSTDFYPSSSELDQYRADPAFVLVATDVRARQMLFPEMTDAQIAEVMLYVFSAAENQSWNHGGFWSALPGTVQLWAQEAAK